MKWFKANKVHGAGKVDFDLGIIYGVAINTEGEAKGHGVQLDADFIADVTRLGNEKTQGLKARFGHPNMSSEALGTYIGRYKNFTTEQTNDGKAISRADLHLAEVAKKAPGGDLYNYVLELADKEPDMFGTSIVFTPAPGFHYFEDNGEKVKTKYFEDVPKDKAAFVSIEALHGNDVVDEPAANPDGLFSQFCADQPAAKVTEFLDPNPQILELFNNDEIRTSFLAKYESYKQKQKAPKMKNKKTGFAAKLKALFQSEGVNIDLSEGDAPEAPAVESAPEAPAIEPAPEAPAPDVELSGQVAELSTEVADLTSQLSAANEAKENFEVSLAAANDAKADAETKLSAANAKLSALGGGLTDGDEENPDLRKFKSWNDAINFQMDDLGKTSKEAFAFCSKNHIDLYPASVKG